MSLNVIEYTDAMCSWAWGTEPKLRLLRWRFEDQIDSWRLVMGHLVEDEHMPERDPVAQAPKLQEYWKVVCDQTGMPRPDPLHRSTTGSRASGLAVKAAQQQSEEAAQAVLRRMRQATFVDGQPADTVDRAIEACRSIEGLDRIEGGLDVDLLAKTVESEAVVEAYRKDGEETRSPNRFVLELEGDRPGIGRAREARDGRMRFVFPTIVVRSSGRGSAGSDRSTEGSADRDSERTVPGWMPYEDYERALFDAGATSTDRTASRPTPVEAFHRWPTLAEAELAFLCGPDAVPPPGIETRTWNGGTLFVRPTAN